MFCVEGKQASFLRAHTLRNEFGFSYKNDNILPDRMAKKYLAEE